MFIGCKDNPAAKSTPPPNHHGFNLSKWKKEGNVGRQSREDQTQSHMRACGRDGRANGSREHRRTVSPLHQKNPKQESMKKEKQNYYSRASLPSCSPFSSLISIMLNTGPVMLMRALFKALISKYFCVNKPHTAQNCCELFAVLQSLH